MQLILDGEQKVVLDRIAEHGLDIVGDVPFSPLHMLAGSMATCTASVLKGWAALAGIDSDRLTISVGWDYAEDPYRVGRFHMELEWPELPESRRTALLRAAGQCTVEQTLRHPPLIETRVNG